MISYLPSRYRLGHALSLQVATPRYAGRQVGFAHNPIAPIAKNHTNLIDIPQTNYYQMILRIIWSNAQVIPLSGEWEWWCYAPPFSYIRGSGSHISLEKYSYCSIYVL